MSLNSDLQKLHDFLEDASADARDGFPYRYVLRELDHLDLTPERVRAELRSAYLEGTADGGNEWAVPDGPSNA